MHGQSLGHPFTPLTLSIWCSGRRHEIRKSEGWIRERVRVLAEGLLERFCKVLNARFWEDAWAKKMAAYRKRPERFAREVLGSSWWSKQREAAEMVAWNRRVAVKSANGVGKTYLAADLALWFLYSHRPSIVLTTAPTWRQVRYMLWEEIRRRFAGARVPLQGKLRVVRLDAGDGSYALGLATDDAVKFQGFL